MSKKKKPVKPPLDDAARMRIAAKRELKSSRQDDRAKLRAEKTARNHPIAVLQREADAFERKAQKLERVTTHALVRLIMDGETKGGLVANDDGTYEFIGCDPDRSERKADDLVDAVLELYSCASGLEFRAHAAQLFHSHLGTQEKPVITIDPCGDAGAKLMTQAHEQIFVEYRANRLDEDDEDLFYEFVADEQTRAEIDERVKLSS